MNEPIRYNPGDPIEAWLTSLLCLDSHTAHRLSHGLPPPKDCDLYFVDRDALFSYHKVHERLGWSLLLLLLLLLSSSSSSSLSMMMMMMMLMSPCCCCMLCVDPGQMSEQFLQRIMSLFVSSHYKVSVQW